MRGHDDPAYIPGAKDGIIGDASIRDAIIKHAIIRDAIIKDAMIRDVIIKSPPPTIEFVLIFACADF